MTSLLSLSLSRLRAMNLILVLQHMRASYRRQTRHREKEKKNTGLLYLLATGYRFLHPRFTRQFLEEHWHKQPEGVVKGERMDGGWRERSMDVHAHVWRRRTGGRQTRPTVSVQFPRHLKMNFSLESLCSALTRWWVPVGLKEEGRCMKLHDE